MTGINFNEVFKQLNFHSEQAHLNIKGKITALVNSKNPLQAQQLHDQLINTLSKVENLESKEAIHHLVDLLFFTNVVQLHLKYPNIDYDMIVGLQNMLENSYIDSTYKEVIRQRLSLVLQLIDDESNEDEWTPEVKQFLRNPLEARLPIETLPESTYLDQGETRLFRLIPDFDSKLGGGTFGDVYRTDEMILESGVNEPAKYTSDQAAFKNIRYQPSIKAPNERELLQNFLDELTPDELQSFMPLHLNVTTRKIRVNLADPLPDQMTNNAIIDFMNYINGTFYEENEIFRLVNESVAKEIQEQFPHLDEFINNLMLQIYNNTLNPMSLDIFINNTNTLTILRENIFEYKPVIDPIKFLKAYQAQYPCDLAFTSNSLGVFNLGYYTKLFDGDLDVLAIHRNQFSPKELQIIFINLLKSFVLILRHEFVIYDIKPANMVANQELESRIVDFGGLFNLKDKSSKNYQEIVDNFMSQTKQYTPNDEYHTLDQLGKDGLSDPIKKKQFLKDLNPYQIFCLGVSFFAIMTKEDAFDLDKNTGRLIVKSPLDQEKLTLLNQTSFSQNFKDLILQMISLDPSKRPTLVQLEQFITNN